MFEQYEVGAVTVAVVIVACLSAFVIGLAHMIHFHHRDLNAWVTLLLPVLAFLIFQRTYRHKIK